MNEYQCEYCRGRFNHRVNLWIHLRREKEKYINGKEGIDYLICRECGLRSESLGNHVHQHGMTGGQYLAKYPDAVLTLPSLVRARADATIGKRFVPIPDRAGAILCEKCDEWYLKRFTAEHLAVCVATHPDKYELNKDYVKCPECSKAMSRLGEHLKKEHGWDKDKLVLEVGCGLRLMASNIADKMNGQIDFVAAQKKREQTHLKRHGYSNPFANPEIQEKIAETSQRRYGASHAMKNEDVFTRQQESARNGPSGQELFFNEHTCDSVVFTGYGGRFIRTKTGVHKYGRLIKDMNPDFMVFPDNVLESAKEASRDRRKMSNEKHRTRYVIELLGNWYHSEGVIGVKPEEHAKEVVESYKSAGIECLVLWEKDVMGRWNEIEPMVSAWIEKAVKDINANPIWRKSTRSKVDRRKGDLIAPDGSGRRFKSHKQLEKWMASPVNYWKPGLEEGRDYVVCMECGARVAKVTEHIRRSHKISKVEYLVRHSGATMMAQRISEAISASCREKPRRRKAA